MKRKLINEIIQKNGFRMQSIIAMEECSELIKAVSKCVRYGDGVANKTNLVEEIADVLICIEQLKVMYHIPDGVIDAWVVKKEKRLIERELNN